MKTKKVILPVEYWEHEFVNGWKNGRCPNRHLIDFLEKYQDQIGPKVLDLGSGDGRHLVLMGFLGYQITGLELTESGINATKSRLAHCDLSAQLVKSTFHDIPFQNESFQTVVSTQALHYNNWPGAKKSFHEVSRVLEPGGLFFFRARSDKGAWRPTDRQIADEKGITRIETRGGDKFIVMVHDYTLDEIQELAADNKLQIVGNPIDEDIAGKPGQWNVTFRKN